MVDSLRSHWVLDPAVTFLNHGSFGACPRRVIKAATRIRAHIECEPVRFFVGELEALIDQARDVVATFLGASPEDLAFVPNATAGVNTVLRSLDFQPGDELLTTDHAYNACRNALEHVASRAGARVTVASVPFPTSGPDVVIEALLARVTPRTRLVLIDHVTSPTALVFPVARMVAELTQRGVDTLVDAAHAPGMLPMNLDGVGAAYTTGNFHKWVCAPKGAAFLHVRRDRQSLIHPLAISHGLNAPRRDRSRFRLLFDWTGTYDPTPFLCVAEALTFLRSLLPGGLAAWMEESHAAALVARDALCAALAVEPSCPDEMVGSMVTVPLQIPSVSCGEMSPFDSLQAELFDRFRIEVPIFSWLGSSSRLLRVSTPPYVTSEDVAQLVDALVELGIAQRPG